MQVEHDIKVLVLDSDYEAEVKKMQEEGWQPAPGFPPIAIFSVVRTAKAAQPPTPFGGKVGGHIDETKVHIIKGGKTE